MKKQLLNIGKQLTRVEQKQVHGGFSPGGGDDCYLDVWYEDGGYANVPYNSGGALNPSEFVACTEHQNQVYPRMVSTCNLSCGGPS
jgi:hypothetical protein